MGRVVLHLDANSFYASVELAYAPHLRGLPVSVGGDADMRHGIVLASSPEAKKKGVRTGMALFEAKKFCPELIVIPPEFEKYKRFSDRIRGMMTAHTPLVESYGLDEAWMEITGPGTTLQDGYDLAALLRRRAREELGITLSAGVSYNKVFAKLGSDYKKPDATTVISKANYKEIVWPLPSSDLLFVGPKSFRRLKDLNILTIGDIASSPPGMLESVVHGPDGTSRHPTSRLPVALAGTGDLFAGLVHPRPVEDAGAQERRADPRGQLRRGLAGEREPEHLLRADGAGADEPHHPRGHDGGLARAGAGDDDARLERRADGVQLLLAEGDAEQVGQLRPSRQDAHAITCPERAGQLPPKGHHWQCPPGVASNRPPSMVRRATASRWCTQVGWASSSGSSVRCGRSANDGWLNTLG